MKTVKKTTRKAYGAIKYESVEHYHAAQTEDVKEILEQLRKCIHKAVPHLTEKISYNMPAFCIDKVLVYYAANKSHVGFYPTTGPIIAFSKELEKFQTSKGAIQFPYNEKLPIGLITKIVKFRKEEEEERVRNKKKK